MTGSRDKFDDDGDLDQRVHDLDLDRDGPLGATFAAALRDQDDGLADDEEPVLDDDGLPTPALPRAVIMLDERAHDVDLDMDGPLGATFAAALRDQDDGLEDDEELVLDDDGFATPAVRKAVIMPPSFSEADPRSPAAMDEFEADEASGDEYLDETLTAETAPAATELSQLPEEYAGEPEAEASGQGLGYDYSFGGSHVGGDRAIPRISIHAFCNKAANLSLMRSITKDRRMKNVSLDVFEGGVQAAIDYYVNETTPNLLVIEGAGDPRQLLAELDSLAEHCDENIRVVVLGHTNDIRFYRELMRRGVSEYLVMPVDPVQMIRAIANLFADPEAPFVGKTVAVTGVKGGVGASSIAHNLAWAMSERIKVNSTLIDLDLNFGTTGLDFNQEAAATIADALMSPDRFDDAVMGRLITKATDRLSLFTAPATLDRTYNLDPETYIRVLERVRGSVPFVVLDMPHIWSDWFKSTIIQADEIIIVASPDLASLRNGKNLIDFLKAARPNDQEPKLVLNMVGLPKRPEIPAKDFGAAIGVEPSLILPFDALLFGTAANNGQMIFDVGPDSKVAQGIDSLAAMLTGKDVQTEKPSLMRKLLGR